MILSIYHTKVTFQTRGTLNTSKVAHVYNIPVERTLF